MEERPKFEEFEQVVLDSSPVIDHVGDIHKKLIPHMKRIEEEMEAICELIEQSHSNVRHQYNLYIQLVMSTLITNFRTIIEAMNKAFGVTALMCHQHIVDSVIQLYRKDSRDNPDISQASYINGMTGALTFLAKAIQHFPANMLVILSEGTVELDTFYKKVVAAGPMKPKKMPDFIATPSDIAKRAEDFIKSVADKSPPTDVDKARYQSFADECSIAFGTKPKE